MKQHIFYTVIFIALLSCTKTIDFEHESYANQVVVNGVISPDRHFSVSIQKSNSIMTKSNVFQSIEGSMDLYEDDVLIKKFPKQLGGFSAQDIYPKPGKTYKMVISSEGKEVVTETTIPDKVEILSIDTSSVKSPGGSRFFFYKVKFKDSPGDDYYQVAVHNLTLRRIETLNQVQKKEVSYSLQSKYYWIMTEDPVFKSVYNNFGDEDVIDIGPRNDYFIFPDDYFDGKEYTLQLSISKNIFTYYGSGAYYQPYGGGPNNKNDIISERTTLYVHRLSKDFYNYMKSLKLYDHYRDFPFAEPVPVYSNVKNGVGIFAGFNNESKYSFEEIYIPYSMDTIKLGGYTGLYGY